MEKLRTDIQQLKRERKEEQGNEEDLSEYMEEDFAEVNVFVTRSSSSSQEAPDAVEEDEPGTLQRLLQQKS
ncbi:hypothetical protein, partial [Bacillus amyloliquefaciens]|uniref:hypothetical protein n=1 Tax=Bacillus amyloliquefaciens TaxID=1390 RepID=UPI00140461EC